MTSKIVRLVAPSTEKRPIDPRFVGWVDELASLARDGTLRAMSFAGVSEDGAVMWGREGECALIDMTAAVALLHHRMMGDAEAEG